MILLGILDYHTFIDALQMLLLLTLLVFIDTFSKWIGIVAQFNRDNSFINTPWNILRGIFFRAWKKGYLESSKYRGELGKKVFVYYLNILVAFIIVVFMPDYKFQGLQADETIAFFIYLAMVLAEIFSIAENFKEMGIMQSTWVVSAIRAVLSKFGVQEPERKDKDK